MLFSFKPCLICQQIHQEKIICLHCLDAFKREIQQTHQKTLCFKCGSAKIHAMHTLCPDCIQSPPKWERLYLLSDYQPLMKFLLHAYKYESKTSLQNIFAPLLYQQLNELGFLKLKIEAICAIPMHKKKYATRGYNPPALIAHMLSKYYQIPIIMSPYICKIKHTKSQIKMHKNIREKNISDAFKIQTIPYQRILIIDDVITTGSTLTAFINSLLKYNPNAIVYVGCLTKNLTNTL